MAKLPNNRNNGPWYIIFICVTLAISGSCTKQPKPSVHGTFLKTYQSDSSNISFYVQQMPDDGYLIYSCFGAGRPMLIRTDPSGNLKWKKIIDKYCLVIPGNWWFSPMGPGHIILQSVPNIIDIDSSGNIINSGTYNSYYTFGQIIDGGNYYYFPSTNGAQSGLPSVNLIIRLDKNFKQKYIYSFSDNIPGGKTLFYQCFGVKKDGSFNLIGTKLARNNWTWSDNRKLFAANVNPITGKIKEIVIDSANLVSDDVLQWYCNGTDSSGIGIGIRTDNTVRATYPFLVKIDKTIKLSWTQTFQLPGYSVMPENAFLCNDGGIMIVGNVQALGDNNSRPYVIKTDQNGRKEWDRVITNAGNGLFYSGSNTKDGGYALIGYSTVFGGSKHGKQALFVKLDKNGNY